MKVLVELIFGHRASILENPTREGHTHDWEVYVKGTRGDIQAFVDRVIFVLHESYPNPRRTVKEPPYSVKGTGYGGFIANIEVYFKTSGKPPKAEFQYDLFLQTLSPMTIPVITPSRTEKLIINHQSVGFMRKLLKGGGVVIRKEKHSPEKASV